MDLSNFAKFISPVEGHLVSRYGTARLEHGPAIIGGRREPIPERDPDQPITIGDIRGGLRGAGQVTLDTSRIEALTHDEWRQFNREYTRAIKQGALKERTAKEYAAQVAAQQELEKEARAKLEAEAEAEAAPQESADEDANEVDVEVDEETPATSESATEEA